MNDDVWRALADPTRRALLDLLRDAPRTTGELAAVFPDVTRFAVMKHLGVLESTGLVVVRRRGRERWNHLNAVPLRQAYERWMAPLAERAAVTSLRLKDFVEERMDLDVANEVTIDAPPERVFDALLRVGQWWPHRFRAGSEVVLEPYVGGRFYEDWGSGEGALYAVVTRLSRPAEVAMSGPMGMGGPVTSVWSMTLSPSESGTVVALEHRAIGDVSEETRAGYTAGWGEVLDALRAAVS